MTWTRRNEPGSDEGTEENIREGGNRGTVFSGVSLYGFRFQYAWSFGIDGSHLNQVFPEGRQLSYSRGTLKGNGLPTVFRTYRKRIFHEKLRPGRVGFIQFIPKTLYTNDYNNSDNLIK